MGSPSVGLLEPVAQLSLAMPCLVQRISMHAGCTSRLEEVLEWGFAWGKSQVCEFQRSDRLLRCGQICETTILKLLADALVMHMFMLSPSSSCRREAFFFSQQLVVHVRFTAGLVLKLGSIPPVVHVYISLLKYLYADSSECMFD